MSLRLEEYLYHAYNRVTHWFSAVGVPLDRNNTFFFLNSQNFTSTYKDFFCPTHNNLTGYNVTAVLPVHIRQGILSRWRASYYCGPSVAQYYPSFYWEWQDDALLVRPFLKGEHVVFLIFGQLLENPLVAIWGLPFHHKRSSRMEIKRKGCAPHSIPQALLMSPCYSRDPRNMASTPIVVHHQYLYTPHCPLTLLRRYMMVFFPRNTM